MANYQNSDLWKHTLGQRDDDPFSEQRNRLRSSYQAFWDRGVQLARQISNHLPDLTLHDEAHLAALWDRASQLVVPDYDINPLEAFIFGGAVLLHDTGHAFSAYEGGLSTIKKTVEYTDTLARLSRPDIIGAIGRNNQNQSNPDKVEKKTLFWTLRNLHAKQAEALATRKFGQMYLIDDDELRESLAQVIGRIAASHNWDRNTLEEKLPGIQGAPGTMPQEWAIRPIKLACLLRCADAVQIDERRAPAFTMALQQPQGESKLHWIAQRLAQPIIKADNGGPGSIIFTSQNDFSADKADAWWVAYELIQTANRELQGCYQLMKDLGLPTFTVDRVAGAESPSRLEHFIRADGWRPVNAEVRITNIEYIIKLFGGVSLYGNDPTVPIRELIQNASDAIRARRNRSSDPFYEGRILLQMEKIQGEDFSKLIIMDDGVGMSERVLTGTLIEFGKSLWGSEDMQSEFPGLLSSNLRQTGRYGIGFFSTLMITSELTVTSRRYDANHVTRSLSFRDGLNLRPLLMDSDGISLHNFSTRVELKLNNEICSSLLTCFRHPQMGGPFKITLRNLIAHICPTLDCDVYVSEGEANVLAHARRWYESEPLPWLREILLAESAPDEIVDRYLNDAAPRLRLIFDQYGSIIGRACVGFGLVPSGIGAIGGLIEGQYARNINHTSEDFVGCIEKKDDGPRRSNGTLDGLESALESWASEQAEAISQSDENEAVRYIAARNVAYFGGDPTPIAMILVDRKLKTLNEVFETIKGGKNIYAVTNFGEVGEPEPQLDAFMYRVNSSLRQSINDTDIEFSDLIMEAWKGGHGQYKAYHKIPRDDGDASSSFLSCLRRFAIKKGYEICSEICRDFIVGRYKGETYKAHNLEKDMELKANVLKLSLRLNEK